MLRVQSTSVDHTASINVYHPILIFLQQFLEIFLILEAIFFLSDSCPLYFFNQWYWHRLLSLKYVWANAQERSEMLKAFTFIDWKRNKWFSYRTIIVGRKVFNIWSVSQYCQQHYKDWNYWQYLLQHRKSANICLDAKVQAWCRQLASALSLSRIVQKHVFPCIFWIVIVRRVPCTLCTVFSEETRSDFTGLDKASYGDVSSSENDAQHKYRIVDILLEVHTNKYVELYDDYNYMRVVIESVNERVYLENPLVTNTLFFLSLYTAWRIKINSDGRYHMTSFRSHLIPSLMQDVRTGSSTFLRAVAARISYVRRVNDCPTSSLHIVMSKAGMFGLVTGRLALILST